MVFCCRGLLPKTTRKEREEQEKRKKGGLALIAAELRRDALIAPSGCGQYRGEEEEEGVQCKRSSSLPDVVIGLMVYIYGIHTSGDRCIYSSGSTAVSLPDETQPPPLHNDTQKQQDVSLGKLLSVSVSMFSAPSVRTRREKISHL